MAIYGVGGAGFNPYANSVGVPRGTDTTNNTSIIPRPTSDSTPSSSTTPASTSQSIATAIQQDATARAAQVSSAKAPDGVDQDLWSVLTKDERSYFVKSGAMGPLTYGRFSSTQTAASAPLVRGGRLDIKA